MGMIDNDLINANMKNKMDLYTKGCSSNLIFLNGFKLFFFMHFFY